MHVGCPSLQDAVRMMPWWVGLGYSPEQDSWLPGGDQSYYALSNPGGDPDASMDDVEKYVAEAHKMLGQLESVIVGLTRDWTQQRQIWCQACPCPGSP